MSHHQKSKSWSSKKSIKNTSAQPKTKRSNNDFDDESPSKYQAISWDSSDEDLTSASQLNAANKTNLYYNNIEDTSPLKSLSSTNRKVVSGWSTTKSTSCKQNEKKSITNVIQPRLKLTPTLNYNKCDYEPFDIPVLGATTTGDRGISSTHKSTSITTLKILTTRLKRSGQNHTPVTTKLRNALKQTPTTTSNSKHSVGRKLSLSYNRTSPKSNSRTLTKQTPTKVIVTDSTDEDEPNPKNKAENPEASIITIDSPNGKRLPIPAISKILASNDSQSQHISEVTESPSSSIGSTLDRRQSISVWVKGGARDQKKSETYTNVISEFESPTKSRNNTEACSGFAVNGGKLRERKSLVQQMKRTLATYSQSVRMFPYKDISSDMNDTLSISLVILKCSKDEGGTISTLSYDLEAKQSRWILFKPSKPSDIVEGSCIRLYHPWQKIVLPSSDIEVIFCTDFYRVCDSKDIGTSPDIIKSVVSSMEQSAEISKFTAFHSAPATARAFLSNLPYSVRNEKTIKKQTMLHKPCINLEVVVCDVWKYINSVFALVKDSDNILSCLEINQYINTSHLCDVMSVGAFVSFTNLGVRDKFTTSSYMPLFSVMSLFGSKQNYCYELGLRADTEWNLDMLLHIKFTPKHPPNVTLSDISLMGDQDCRINIECRAKNLNSSQIRIWDKSGQNIRIQLLPLYEDQFPPIEDTKKSIKLQYVRYLKGTLSMDRFSSIVTNIV